MYGDVKWSKIEAHEQKCKNSCIPSAVEMVLKLLGRVGRSYYELQRGWNDRKDGSFALFINDFTNNGELEGLTFRKHYCQADGLFQIVDRELEEGRYVIISLKNPNTPGYHQWIIYGKTDDDYLNFSKASCSSQMITFQCCFQCSLRNYVRNVMCRTDILTYMELT